jgi:hypothetical protein
LAQILADAQSANNTELTTIVARGRTDFREDAGFAVERDARCLRESA